MGTTGIARDTWLQMAGVDAVPILKQNIIALDKCPTNYRNLWRLALTEVNQAGQSDDEMIRKGAEITQKEHQTKNGYSFLQILQWSFD